MKPQFKVPAAAECIHPGVWPEVTPQLVDPNWPQGSGPLSGGSTMDGHQPKGPLKVGPETSNDDTPVTVDRAVLVSGDQLYSSYLTMGRYK